MKELRLFLWGASQKTAAERPALPGHASLCWDGAESQMWEDSLGLNHNLEILNLKHFIP